jgi:ABC-type Zn2+ transport system substrate-binding protein/surface adhesin
MVAGMVALEQVRQLDAKRVSENGNDDRVQKQQDRSDNADAHDNADNQSERNCNDCKGILVGHRATMPPFARGRQG